MAESEHTLLQKARAFDLDALAVIYDRYSPGVYRYALRLLGDPALAEDCTAETFKRFLLALRGGGGPQDHLQAYLFRIAHNWITDQYRRQPPALQALDDEMESRQPAADDAVFESIRQAQVRAAVACLTPEQRQVVALKFVEGWDNQSIASALEKPLSAVKALQHRALASLRRMLLPQEENV